MPRRSRKPHANCFFPGHPRDVVCTVRLTEAERAEVQSLTNYNIQAALLHHADGTLLREREVLLEHNAPEAAPWWAQF